MKSFTLASITAMVSMYTQAFALEYYSCNGKHINYFILVDYVALMYNKLCERNGASYSAAPVVAATGAETYICYPVD
uniref:Bgt_avrF2_17 n=1 Tax=Blumeria graminis f. sp. tritici 96224 TaxID=1268274 RepID=A0A381L133_BLUGR